MLVDRFFAEGTGVGNALVVLAAQTVPDGMTGAAWMLDYAERLEAYQCPCPGAVADWVDAEVGGAPARRLVGKLRPRCRRRSRTVHGGRLGR